MTKEKVIVIDGYYHRNKGTNTYQVMDFARHFITGELMIVFRRVTCTGKIKPNKVHVMSKDQFIKSQLEQTDLILEKK